MGRPKQLLPVNGRAAVRFCLESILAAGITDTVVVTGAQSAEIAAALHGLSVRFVRNPSADSEMADSVRLGLRETGSASRTILVFLADHPLVRPETIRLVIAASVKEPGRIVIPCYQGRRGHPTAFPRPCIEEVYSGKNLRDIINVHAAGLHAVDVDDEGVVLDMDTEADYERVQRTAGDLP
jgi:CTP:molybdopterin cytidylyltransferase MocA